MTIQELLILSPIMFLALGALIAILLEITTRNVSHVIYVSIVFLILSLRSLLVVSFVVLFVELDDWLELFVDQ